MRITSAYILAGVSGFLTIVATAPDPSSLFYGATVTTGLCAVILAISSLRN